MSDTKPVISVSDLIDMIGFGYAHTLGDLIGCLAQAATGTDTLVWLTRALAVVDKLKTYSFLPSFPLPVSKLDTFAEHALPVEYAKALSLLWRRPGQPQVLRAAIEAILQEAAKPS